MRPNHAMIDRLKAHRDAGDEIYIICNRPVTLQPRLEGWCGLLGVPYHGIYLPSREFPDLTAFKIDCIKAMSIDKHYDDHWHLINLAVACPPVICVPASF